MPKTQEKQPVVIVAEDNPEWTKTFVSLLNTALILGGDDEKRLDILTAQTREELHNLLTKHPHAVLLVLDGTLAGESSSDLVTNAQQTFTHIREVGANPTVLMHSGDINRKNRRQIRRLTQDAGVKLVTAESKYEFDSDRFVLQVKRAVQNAFTGKQS